MVRLAEQDKNIINFKLGDVVKINNEILYIKDIRHDKPDFPSKTKENVLVLETINLSNPSTYYFNSRDNRTPSRIIFLFPYHIIFPILRFFFSFQLFL